MKQFIFSSESSQSRHINNGEKLKWVAKAGEKYKVIEQNGELRLNLVPVLLRVLSYI